jgi:hypothetical protein
MRKNIFYLDVIKRKPYWKFRCAVLDKKLRNMHKVAQNNLGFVLQGLMKRGRVVAPCISNVFNIIISLFYLIAPPPPTMFD